jgi:hypothetical protein
VFVHSVNKTKETCSMIKMGIGETQSILYPGSLPVRTVIQYNQWVKLWWLNLKKKNLLWRSRESKKNQWYFSGKRTKMIKKSVHAV